MAETEAPKSILPGTSLASVAISPTVSAVFYQDGNGGIWQATYDGEWKKSPGPLFSAKLGSPLTAVAWANGLYMRVYSVSKEGSLQEWCYANWDFAERKGWHPGDLQPLKIQPGSSSSLASTQWEDYDKTQIRLYYQDSSDALQELESDGNWGRGITLPIPAISGSSLSACNWDENGTCICVYYQSPDLALREYCSDTGLGWYRGKYTPGKIPGRAAISALVWFEESAKQLEVLWQDHARNVVRQRFSFATALWQDLGTVVLSFASGTRMAVLSWNKDDDLKVYRQSKIHDIVEHSLQQNGKAGSSIAIVAISFKS